MIKLSLFSTKETVCLDITPAALSNEFMENRVHFGVMECHVTKSKSCLGNLWSNFRLKLSLVFLGCNFLRITYFHEISNDFGQMKCIV